MPVGKRHDGDAPGRSLYSSSKHFSFKEAVEHNGVSSIENAIDGNLDFSILDGSPTGPDDPNINRRGDLRPPGSSDFGKP